MKEKTKVIAYFFRTRNTQLELLVFDHRDMPEAGTQVIGGTVDPGENLLQAIVREIKEESGLEVHDAHLKFIGKTQYIRKDNQEMNHRNYYAIDGDHLPEKWSHQVVSSGLDSNLIFDFYWITIDQAMSSLVGSFQELLHLI